MRVFTKVKGPQDKTRQRHCMFSRINSLVCNTWCLTCGEGGQGETMRKHVHVCMCIYLLSSSYINYIAFCF